MAALNHMKNRKSQKAREGLEDFIARCLDGGTSVQIDVVLEMFESMDMEIDEKDLKKMEKLADGNRNIPRLTVF
jgi:hypothetical protein